MPALLGNVSKGFAIIVSAPAGTGKTTLVRKLIDEFPDVFTQSMSCTTRPPREGEIDGKDYLFLTESTFQKRIDRNEFLEHVQLFDHHYGTLKETVEQQRLSGKHVILVIDTQGALALKRKIKALSVFVTPPSIDILKQRLVRRQTESEEVIEKRLDWAQHEMDQTEHYDYRIVNDDLNTAYQILKSIIIAEEHRT